MRTCLSAVEAQLDQYLGGCSPSSSTKYLYHRKSVDLSLLIIKWLWGQEIGGVYEFHEL